MSNVDPMFWIVFSGLFFFGGGAGGLQFGSKLHESVSYGTAVECIGPSPTQRKSAIVPSGGILSLNNLQ